MAKKNRSTTPSLAVRTRALIMGVLPVVAIFLGTRQLLAEAYRIPSGSMEPTLLVGDWLFVNKLRFGPHIPFTSHSLPGYASPKRGDVTVFVSPPQHPSIRISPDQITPMLVKRIVGVGGDTLVMRHGELTVNGVVVPLRHAPVPNAGMRDWGPYIVPVGTYFMMGDNRDNSIDSRYYGPVPRANLRGTPMFVYYSYDPEEGVDYIRAVTAIRWRRLGTWIR